MILRIVNTATNEVLLEDEFTNEELGSVLPNWEIQTQLYGVQTPPISARLEVIDPDNIPPEE